jgi:hypothetical protein
MANVSELFDPQQPQMRPESIENHSNLAHKIKLEIEQGDVMGYS